MVDMEAKIDVLLEVMTLIRQGQELLLDGLNALNDRVAAIETELTKEPPPSKAAAVLADLVEAVDQLGVQIGDLTEAVREGLADEDDASAS